MSGKEYDSYTYRGDGLSGEYKAHFHYEVDNGLLATTRITRYNVTNTLVFSKLYGRPLLLSHVPITSTALQARQIKYHSDQQSYFGAPDYRWVYRNSGGNPVTVEHNRYYRHGGGGSGPMVFYLTHADYANLRISFPVIASNGKHKKGCILNQGSAAAEHYIDKFGTRKYTLSGKLQEPLLSYNNHRQNLSTVSMKNISFGYDENLNNLQIAYNTNPITIRGLGISTENGYRKIRLGASDIRYNKIKANYDISHRLYKGKPINNPPLFNVYGEFSSGLIESDRYKKSKLTGYEVGVNAVFKGISAQDNLSIKFNREFAAVDVFERNLNIRYSLHFAEKLFQIIMTRKIEKNKNVLHFKYQMKF